MKLENKYVSFEFNKKNGSLSQITDLTTKKEYFNNPEGNRLVKLLVPTEDHITMPIYSHHAGAPEFLHSDTSLKIIFPELKYKGKLTNIFITVNVELPKDSKEALFTLEIDNKSKYMVYEAWFPYIGGRCFSHTETKDILTTSLNTQNVYETLYKKAASTHTFGNHHNRINIGPEFMLPIMDISDDQGGLSYIKYQKEPSPQILMFENPLYNRDKICLTWAWASAVFVSAGEKFTTAPCGIGVHSGDWHNTADSFKDWLKTWWTPCDTPQHLKEKVALFHTTCHGFSGEPIFDFKDLPDIARDCLKYDISDLLFWDYTASIYLRPDKGDFWEMSEERELELKNAIKEIKTLGVDVSSFVNLRLLVKYNSTYEKRKHLAQKSLYDTEIYGFGPCSMDGGRYQEPGLEMGSVAICYGADEYLPYAEEVLNKTFDLGFEVFALDQGAEWNYCLSKDHGHKSPWEAWERSYKWFGDLTKKVRSINSNAYTISEVPDLYNMNKLDLWWDWGWRDNESGNLPFFKYIIPEFIAVWGIDENQIDIMAEAFSLGSMLAIATKGMNGKLSDVPELADRVLNLSKLKKATAKFVSHGNFLDNKGISTSTGKAYVYESDSGLAIAIANSNNFDSDIEISLDLNKFNKADNFNYSFYLEGSEPTKILPINKENKLTFKVHIPKYFAGVITLANK